MDRDAGSRGMREADRQKDPNHLIEHLDNARASESIQLLKQTSYAMLRIELGHRLLDAGCGTGEDVQALVALSGPDGRIVGIDASETFVAEARERAEALAAIVSFQTGDGHALDFDDASFDGVRAERARDAGMVTKADTKKWLDDLGEAGRVGTFFCSVTMFATGGTKA